MYLILIVGVISIFVLPLIFTLKVKWLPDFTGTGQVGDTINGVAGPFIALLAAFLTFMAFFIQYLANKMQLEQFKTQKEQFDMQLYAQTEHFNLQLAEQKRQFSYQSNLQHKQYAQIREQSQAQEKVWELERFESKFYEMLRLHRTNVDEMQIAGKYTQRRVFIPMFRELRICYNILFNLNELRKSQNEEYLNNPELLYDLAYKVFFFGIGPDSKKQLDTSLLSEQLKILDESELYFKEVRRWFNDYKGNTNSTPNKELNKNFNWENIEQFYSYFPFDGHASRLGHMYRHLYQTVKYIVNQTAILLDQKQEYLNLLRAQLSNHEQLLLYYNGLSMGKKWFSKGYFTKYRMIHNLPLPLADFGIRPKDHQVIQEGIEYWKNEGKNMFEWDKLN